MNALIKYSSIVYSIWISALLMLGLACGRQQAAILPETVSPWDLIISTNSPALYSGTDIAYTGKVVDYYADGKSIRYRAIYQEGLKHGEESEYYPDGSPFRKCQYKEGKKQGKEIRWHSNGRIQSTTNYLNHLPTGKGEFWNTNGIISLTAEFDNGNLVSIQSYHSNGKPRRHSSMVYGIQHGFSKQWHPNGNLEWVAPYKEGKKHGITMGWSENGSKLWEAEWNKGLSHGLSKKWYPNGILKSYTAYKNGLKDGEAIGAYENGKLEWEAKWKQDQLHGTYREWHPNGDKKLERIYLGGKQSSEIKWSINGSNPNLDNYGYGKKLNWSKQEFLKFKGLDCQKVHFVLGLPDEVTKNSLIYRTLKIQSSPDLILKEATIRIETNRVSFISFSNVQENIPATRP